MRVGVVGLGNIGRELTKRLSLGAIPGMTLHSVSHRDPQVAVKHLITHKIDAKCLSLENLVCEVDVVAETATADAIPQIASATMAQGKTLVLVSAAGLLNARDAIALARAGQGRIIIANGMLPGLDIIRAASEGNIRSVSLRTTLRPSSLENEPFIDANDIKLPVGDEPPVRIIEGTARDVATAFPRHFNIAISLSLAGTGLDNTHVRVDADPRATGSRHDVRVEADEVSLRMTATGVPSPENPKTSRLVMLSIIAAIRRWGDGVQVGG